MGRGQYITPKESRSLFESEPSAEAIHRWMKQGVPNRRSPGERIYLQCIREGGIVLTTAAWVREFQQACQSNTKARK